MLKWLSALLIQLILLAAISTVSRFPAPDFTEANWDIVLFLTPIGMLRNWNAESPVMRSFYQDISAGQIELGGWQWFAMTLLYIAMLIHALWFMRKTAR